MKRVLATLGALLVLSTSACASQGEEVKTPANTSGAALAGESDGTSEEKGNLTTAPEENDTPAVPAGEVSVSEQVLVDEQGVKISLKSLDMDAWLGPELKVLIENNTDLDLTFQTRGSSVNGYMIETMMSPNVSAGKKVNDEITIMSSELESAGITTIADLEFSFHIFTSDDWDTYVDTEPVIIKTSAADTYDYAYDDSGELLYEGGGIRIISKGMAEDSIFGPGLNLYIENFTDESITVQTRDLSINGFMVSGLFSAEVTSQKRVIDDVTFMSSDLEDNGIETITDLEFAFHIIETDGWDTIVDTEKIVLGLD